MICTEYNEYMKNLVNELEMLWIVTLNNGTKVYSDYGNHPTTPWSRLKLHCEQSGLYPIKVENLMFGAPKIIMAEDSNGLDGLIILRGASKDFSMDSGDGMSYQQLIVGVLNDHNEIDVTRFCWPENTVEAKVETRQLTSENTSLMFFKNESEKKLRPVVQFALNGTAV